jgi:energy-coupling factor transporter ATP-binding protein EcfA2
MCEDSPSLRRTSARTEDAGRHAPPAKAGSTLRAGLGYDYSMKVELRNIGPINRAALELDGLSLLVGPNGSGKTTLSTVCYAVLSARRTADFAIVRRARNAVGGSRQAEPSPTEAQLGREFADVFRAALAKELARCYSQDVSKIPRRGRAGNGSAPRIVVSDSSPAGGPWLMAFRLYDEALRLEPDYPGFRLASFPEILAEISAGKTPVLFGGPHNIIGDSTLYFPAGRAGYVQMQSVVAALLMSALGRGDFQISVGKISGIAADFLQFLAAVNPSRLTRVHRRIADRLEDELLGGHLRVSSAGDVARVIEFAPEGLLEYWQMDATATSVAEVAPLLLYLRHRARRDDRLFIDEPEAHLHPANQLILADILVELSSLCAGMVIGTHSALFVQGIANSHLRRQDQVGHERTVSLNQLCAAKTTGGYESVATVLDSAAGFDVDQFSLISEAALDEADRLFLAGQSS